MASQSSQLDYCCLMLFDCCFSPLNNIEKCEAIGIMMTTGCTFQNSEVLMIHSYSLRTDGMGWNINSAGIYMVHAVLLLVFFRSRSGRTFLYLAWLI